MQFKKLKKNGVTEYLTNIVSENKLYAIATGYKENDQDEYEELSVFLDKKTGETYNVCQNECNVFSAYSDLNLFLIFDSKSQIFSIYSGFAPNQQQLLDMLNTDYPIIFRGEESLCLISEQGSQLTKYTSTTKIRFKLLSEELASMVNEDWIQLFNKTTNKTLITNFDRTKTILSPEFGHFYFCNLNWESYCKSRSNELYWLKVKGTDPGTGADIFMSTLYHINDTEFKNPLVSRIFDNNEYWQHASLKVKPSGNDRSTDLNTSGAKFSLVEWAPGYYMWLN
ncbi:MAG: hypothetical protein KDD58_01080 [Bdellovibrionales bacterium]|nr:hypothetical protein [Bdellovibrionales bacterium]